MENKAKKPYRDLEESEVDALFSFYDKHNGNVSEMARDKDCRFNTRNQIIYYKDKYDFSNRLTQIVTERTNKFKKEWEEMLKEGKLKCIKTAITLLEPKEGKPASNSDVKTAYDIIKIELGEPTTISRNTNIDETEEIKKALNIIKNGVEECDKTIPDRGEASGTDGDTTDDIPDNSSEE